MALPFLAGGAKLWLKPMRHGPGLPYQDCTEPRNPLPWVLWKWPGTRDPSADVGAPGRKEGPLWRQRRSLEEDGAKADGGPEAAGQD